MKKILIALITLSGILIASEGAELYTKCVGCHGALGEKSALGKSRVINEMGQEDIITALKGYQDGSYGGVMKALMKGQVANLSEQQITALADEISHMKQ